MARPFVIGLTGGIAMGKSETASMFERLGVPVLSADAIVHRLYEHDAEIIAAIGKAFPGTVTNSRVDRAELSARLVGRPDAFAALDAIIHPAVERARHHFLKDSADAEMVVFDIPLLFETGKDAAMDAVVVVSAPSHVQRERALARPGMTAEKFDALSARQMPDVDKRAKAHFVVVSDKGLAHAFDQVKMIVAEIRNRKKLDA